MRLVLGDDQAIFLDALSTVLIQRGYEVGAVARSPEEMIAFVRHQRPDACLIDCNLAVDEGIRTIQRVIEASESTTVVVLGADPDVDAAELAMDAGASGYLHQSRGVEVLVSALERMPSGERVIDLPDASPARRLRRSSHADTVAATLTGRERECLSLLVAGLDTAAIVAQMGVSRTTVRTHLQSVLTKLGVHSRLEAASFAVRHHLVDAWADPTAAAPELAAGIGVGASPAPNLAVGAAAGAEAGSPRVAEPPRIPAVARATQAAPAAGRPAAALVGGAPRVGAAAHTGSAARAASAARTAGAARTGGAPRTGSAARTGDAARAVSAANGPGAPRAVGRPVGMRPSVAAAAHRATLRAVGAA
jgi:two-component system nitrate/nitrite response regulator NarL